MLPGQPLIEHRSPGCFDLLAQRRDRTQPSDRVGFDPHPFPGLQILIASELEMMHAAIEAINHRVDGAGVLIGEAHRKHPAHDIPALRLRIKSETFGAVRSCFAQMHPDARLRDVLLLQSREGIDQARFELPAPGACALGEAKSFQDLQPGAIVHPAALNIVEFDDTARTSLPQHLPVEICHTPGRDRAVDLELNLRLGFETEFAGQDQAPRGRGYRTKCSPGP